MQEFPTGASSKRRRRRRRKKNSHKQHTETNAKTKKWRAKKKTKSKATHTHTEARFDELPKSGRRSTVVVMTVQSNWTATVLCVRVFFCFFIFSTATVAVAIDKDDDDDTHGSAVDLRKRNETEKRTWFFLQRLEAECWIYKQSCARRGDNTINSQAQTHIHRDGNDTQAQTQADQHKNIRLEKKSNQRVKSGMRRKWLWWWRKKKKNSVGDDDSNNNNNAQTHKIEHEWMNK